jgi:hypothetical protein
MGIEQRTSIGPLISADITRTWSTGKLNQNVKSHYYFITYDIYLFNISCHNSQKINRNNLEFGMKCDSEIHILVRALSDVVARGTIVAGDDDAAAVAGDASTADFGGGAPHHLRVVAAHLAGGAAVAPVVVPLLL